MIARFSLKRSKRMRWSEISVPDVTILLVLDGIDASCLQQVRAHLELPPDELMRLHVLHDKHKPGVSISEDFAQCVQHECRNYRRAPKS